MNNGIVTNIIPQKKVSDWFAALTYAIVLCVNLIRLPQTPSSYQIIRLLQVVEILIWAFLLFQNIRYHVFQKSAFSILTHSWWIILVLISIKMVDNMPLTVFFNWINVWILLLTMNLTWKDDSVNQIRIISVLLSLLCYLNAVLVVIFPDGLWEEADWIGTGDSVRYLFGNYNQTGIVAFLAIMTQAICCLRVKKGYINLFLLCAVNIAVVFFLGSMTSTVGLVILSAYLLFRHQVKHPFLWITVFVVVFLLFFKVIVWNDADMAEYPIISDFIENVLHKNLTFTSRTTIWQNVVDLIQNNPLTGYGVQSIDWMVDNIGGSGPHNLLLMLMLQGGIVSLSIFIGLIVIVLRKGRQQGSPESIFALVALCVLMLMSLFETYPYVCIFLTLSVIYYISVYSAESVKEGVNKCESSMS